MAPQICQQVKRAPTASPSRSRKASEESRSRKSATTMGLLTIATRMTILRRPWHPKRAMRSKGCRSNFRLRSWTKRISVRNRLIALDRNSDRDRAKRTPLQSKKKMVRMMFQLKTRQNEMDRCKAGDREKLIGPKKRTLPSRETQEGTISLTTCSR